MWRQGEHVAIIGDTGSGKTYLINALGDYRTYWLFLRTKREDPRDDPMDRKWRRVKRIADVDTTGEKWLIDPPSNMRAREGFMLLGKAEREGSWTVGVDELFQCTKIGLGPRIEELITTSRSNKVTFVCGVQRPVGFTRWALAECTHAFIFSSEGRDYKTLTEAFTPRLKDVLPKLNFYKHEFAYYNRRTRDLFIANARDLPGILGR